MYLILKADDDVTNPKHGIRKAKGVPSKIVKKEFHHKRYNKALFDLKHEDKITFCTIRSDKYSIYILYLFGTDCSLSISANRYITGCLLLTVIDSIIKILVDHIGSVALRLPPL